VSQLLEVKTMVAESLRWTTRDLEVMPDDGGWKRYEIIDGELYVTRAPHFRHQNFAGKLQIHLGAWSEATELGSVVQTPGVIFTPTDAVIPDLVWASRETLATGLDQAGHFIVTPELVVEVLSAGPQNEQRDKETKLKLYSRHGVREYWIADWQRQTLEVYRRQEAQLHLFATLLITDTLTSPLLPEFTLLLEQVF
jgi:Uma2 family endonuclease